MKSKPMPDDFRERFRLVVLAAFDHVAGELIAPNHLGATDADLPYLFPAIDAQAQRLWDRKQELAWAALREEGRAIMEGRATLVDFEHPIRRRANAQA